MKNTHHVNRRFKRSTHVDSQHRGASNMPRRDLWAIAALVMASLSLTACGQALRASPDAPTTIAPAKVEQIEGTKLSRVTLTAKGAERIEVKTAAAHDVEVTRSGKTTVRRAVPYAAVLYDSNNATWVYTNPEPLVYVRQSITVDYIDRDQAILLNGPPVGAAVVTVGAAELFGTELEIGEQ